MSARLEDWSCRYTGDPYAPPECRSLHLVGVVTGHHRIDDGKRMETSGVVSAEGRVVRTRSGSVYVLGEPSSGYREWLKKERPDWDPENPISFIKEPQPEEQSA